MIGFSQLALFLIVALPVIIYLFTLHSTLNKIRPSNRTIKPGLVWLSLIPIFGQFWQINVVNQMANSLKNEFNTQNISVDEELPGRSIGLAYSILFCTTLIPILGTIASLAGFVCWIIYWIKINRYKNLLGNTELLDNETF